MDHESKQPEALAAGELSAPILPEKPRFSASWRELLAAVLIFVPAYYYSDIWWETGKLVFFLLSFVALAELLHWRQPRSRESWVWLGCLLTVCLACALGRCHAWELHNDLVPALSLHLLAVWWLLSRSGRLLEGESGHLLPLDAVNGLFVFPFKHFLLRLRTLWYGLTRLGGGKKLRFETVFWPVAALLVAGVLFVWAVRLLSEADEGFAGLIDGLTGWLHITWDEEFLIRFFFSLPVGAYLFGLLSGTARETREKLDARADAARRRLAGLRRVPDPVWTVLTGCFCLLYLVFFAVQARYLFGAFTRTLPEGFIVSEYARRGFFELCRVMAVNFALLWLVTRLSASPVRENRPALAVCLILTAESLLFAVVAFSKLALYIDCFGFTPLRLQSCWGVTVLAAGAVCAGVSLVTGRKSMRPWMIFSAVSFSLLCLY